MIGLSHQMETKLGCHSLLSFFLKDHVDNKAKAVDNITKSIEFCQEKLRRLVEAERLSSETENLFSQRDSILPKDQHHSENIGANNYSRMGDDDERADWSQKLDEMFNGEALRFSYEPVNFSL